MRTEDFAYDLPESLIAQEPLPDRSAARLLVLGRRDGAMRHARVDELPDLLRPGDLLVFNDTRVLPARIFARRPSGGRVELLLLHAEGAGSVGADGAASSAPVARGVVGAHPPPSSADRSRAGAPGRVSLSAPGDVAARPETSLPREAAGAGAVADIPGDGESSGSLWRALARPLRRIRVGERMVVEPAGDAPADSPAPETLTATPTRAPIPVGPAAERAGGPPPRTDAAVRVLAVLGEGEVRVEFEGSLVDAAGVRGLLRRHGTVPLPPYVRRPVADPERYQTVYARHEGSAAAPTAGLHFTPRLLERLRTAGIGAAHLTLHVGLGTFRPVSADRPEDHHMHAEWCRVPAETAEAIEACRRRGGRVVAVGTTVVRTLESRVDRAGRVSAGAGWTDIYILPGHAFRAIDGMLTNFHLPRSTLLMLVSAFAGRENVLAAYREAVSRAYRFYSFGDAMLVL